MPYLVRNGVRLHYRLTGKGPLVVLQHALTNDERAYDYIGLRARLEAAGRSCLTVDSVAHGRSDTPSDPGRYGWRAQAADLLAVADHIGAKRFSFVGYSMGAWIGTGVVALAPERVRTAVLGGWDPIEGARRFTKLDEPEARNREFTWIVRSLYAARGAKPPSDGQLAGYLSCYGELFEPLPPLEVLAASGVELALFCGDRDPYLPNVRRTAETLGRPVQVVAGDHVEAFMAAESADFVLACLAGG